LPGNSFIIGVLQSDLTGFVGQPASEIDLTFISTFSPFLIGISIWLIFTTSPSPISGETHLYLPNDES